MPAQIAHPIRVIAQTVTARIVVAAKVIIVLAAVNNMLAEKQAKALAAIKRLQGLTTKVEAQIQGSDRCADILRNVLAMKGHIEHIQSQVLESHLHTCAERELSSSNKDEFIQELLQVINHSSR